MVSLTRRYVEHLALAGEGSPASRKMASGARLRGLRRARGLTQEELAQATGVSRSAVAQWETGRAGLANKLQEIAAALKVPTRDLRLRVIPTDPFARQQLRADEGNLLMNFRALELEDQELIVRLLHRLTKCAW